MPMSRRMSCTWIALGVLATLGACHSESSRNESTEERTESRTAGCGSDRDCKGDRICVDGSCRSSKDEGGDGVSPAAAPPTAIPTASSPPVVPASSGGGSGGVVGPAPAPPPPPAPAPVPQGPNKVFPCTSDADCHAPYQCGMQGNCQRLDLPAPKPAPARGKCSMGAKYFGPCGRTGCEPGYTCNEDDGHCYCTR